MKTIWIKASLPLILVSLSSGCAPAEETASDESVHADGQALTSFARSHEARAALEAARARRRPYSGSIAALRFKAPAPFPTVTLLDVDIFDGPSPHSQSCTYKNVGGCELRTCDDAIEPGALTNVGTITVEGESATASISPNAQGTYDDLVVFNSLWDNPRERVKISFFSPKVGVVRTNQLVPAIDLSITEAVPSVVQQGKPVRISWTGAKPGDRGKVYVHLMSTEGAELPGGGTVQRSQLVCSAPPSANRINISANAMSRLPAGSYQMLVQAESRTDDRTGIQHALISIPSNHLSTFVIQ